MYLNRRAFLMTMIKTSIGGLALAAAFGDVFTTDSGRLRRKPNLLSALRKAYY